MPVNGWLRWFGTAAVVAALGLSVQPARAEADSLLEDFPDIVTMYHLYSASDGHSYIEEMKVPPKSLVMCSPGRVKRLLTHAEAADIQMFADRYVGYRLEYMGG